MFLFEFEGARPQVHAEAFVAATATLIGDVTVEAGASVWYGAVLRGDFAPLVVRAGANVQDGSVLHSPPGMPCDIGPGATIAHLCVVHGATIGAEALIGNHATVLDGAVVGRRAMVAAGSLVPAGRTIPDEVVAMGSPAQVKGPLAGSGAELWVDLNPAAYQDLARRHRSGIAPVAPSGAQFRTE
ncbi:gamma carbonic anhydrase family protein [Spirillospora sp. CA-294931]|uniref:gamma carbonic anhydrase family protein n=1 Tax=Spirillospora sp. CA-294931 TaxID=3240042 RepID=UPI003D8D0B25